MPSIFDHDLPRTEANYAALSPLSFIERSAEVYPNRLAVVHGDLRRSWAEFLYVVGNWPAACSGTALARATQSR